MYEFWCRKSALKIISAMSLAHHRHSRESGNPEVRSTILWIPAFAGMTQWLSGKITFLFLVISCLLLTGCQQQSNHTYQGYVEGELIFMASPFSGDVVTLDVHRGEKVKQRQTLFTLDPEPEKSQLTEATKKFQQAQATLQNLIKGQRDTILEGIVAQINQTKADLILAKERLARNQELYVKDAIDADSLDAAKATYKSKLEQLKQFKANLEEAKLGSRADLIKAQEANVDAAKANLKSATWSLQQKTISAPTNGVIFDTFFKQGEWVAQGKPVLALLSPQNIRIIFYIPEPILSQIQLNQQVEVTCDQCQKSYTAWVSYISPEAEYTPPLIYSRENNYKLVYRIRAIPKQNEAMLFHPGQPVYVKLNYEQ